MKKHERAFPKRKYNEINQTKKLKIKKEIKKSREKIETGKLAK